MRYTRGAVVIVRLGELLAIVGFGEIDQHFYAAEIIGGSFGTGLGEELASPIESEAGTYDPLWIPCNQLIKHRVYPERLAKLIAMNSLDTEPQPLIFKEI